MPNKQNAIIFKRSTIQLMNDEYWGPAFDRRNGKDTQHKWQTIACDWSKWAEWIDIVRKCFVSVWVNRQFIRHLFIVTVCPLSGAQRKSFSENGTTLNWESVSVYRIQWHRAMVAFWKDVCNFFAMICGRMNFSPKEIHINGWFNINKINLNEFLFWTKKNRLFEQ